MRDTPRCDTDTPIHQPVGVHLCTGAQVLIFACIIGELASPARGLRAAAAVVGAAA